MSNLIDEEKEMNPLIKSLVKQKIVPRSEQQNEIKNYGNLNSSYFNA